MLIIGVPGRHARFGADGAAMAKPLLRGEACIFHIFRSPGGMKNQPRS